jgi:MFS family permease
MVTYLVALVDRQLLSLLVGPLKQGLDLTDTQVGMLQGLAFGLFYTLLGIPIGRLIDSWSRRNVIAIGAFLWCLMTAACGLAGSFAHLFLARVGVGVGEATMSPGALSMLSDYFAPARRALAISVYIAGGSLGSGVALIIGGTVIDHFVQRGPVHLPLLGVLQPWQSVFVAVGLTGLVAVALLLTVHEPPRRLGAGEHAGSAPSWREFGRFLAARRRLFVLHFGGMGLFSVLSYGLLAWAPTFFIRHHGWTATQVGITFGSIVALCGFVGVISGGAWATRRRAAGVADATLRTAAFGFAAIVLPAIAGPLLADPRLSLGCYALCAFFMAFPSGVSAAALQEVTPNRLRAQTSAVYYFAINLLGLGFGPVLVGLLTDRVFGDESRVGESLALSAVLLGPPAALMLYAALRPFAHWQRVGAAQAAAPGGANG